jgi:hypothetical protein
VLVVVTDSVFAFVMYTCVFVPISLTRGSPVAAAYNLMPGMYMDPTGGKNKRKAPVPDIGASVKRLPGAAPDPGGMSAVMPGMYMSEVVSDEAVQYRPLARVLGTFGVRQQL